MKKKADNIAIGSNQVKPTKVKNTSKKKIG